MAQPRRLSARALQVCREAVGLSLTELAAVAGVNPQTIWRIEHGLAATDETLHKIKVALRKALRKQRTRIRYAESVLA